MKQISYDSIAKRIRETRLEQKLTQEYIANICDVNVSHISNIETVRAKPSLPLIISIANALGVSVDYLLIDNYKKSSDVLNQLIYREVDKCTDERKKTLLEVVKVFARN